MLFKFTNGGSSISIDGDTYSADEDGVVDIPKGVWERRKDKSAVLPLEEVIIKEKEPKSKGK